MQGNSKKSITFVINNKNYKYKYRYETSFSSRRQ
jgi:hypothetical protein